MAAKESAKGGWGEEGVIGVETWSIKKKATTWIPTSSKGWKKDLIDGFERNIYAWDRD